MEIENDNENDNNNKKIESKNTDISPEKNK